MYEKDSEMFDGPFASVKVVNAIIIRPQLFSGNCDYQYWMDE